MRRAGSGQVEPDQKTTALEAHRATETSGGVQHLTFNLNTQGSEGGLIQLFCAKRASENLPGSNQPWKFYRCQVVPLDA